MMRTKRLIYIAVFLLGILAFCTGCNKERLQEQEQYRIQGITYLQSGKYEEALKAFQYALDLSIGTIGDKELDICYYKAETLILMGKTEEAIDTYRAIIAYNKSPKAYFLRGNAYYSRIDDADVLAGEDEYAVEDYIRMATEDYEKAVSIEKKDYELYIGIYDALSAHGRVLEGAEYLVHALQIEGDTSYDNMQKGRINFLLGKYEDAVTMLSTAAKSGEIKAYYYLLETYLGMDDAVSAKTALMSYLDANTADSFELYEIAEERILEGRYDLAALCLEKALKQKEIPNHRLVMRTLVITYEKQLDFASAREVLTTYVNLYPEDEEAKKELTFLETR